MRPIARISAAVMAAALSCAAAGAAAAAVVITIDKDAQRMTVLVNGVQRHDWPVSTGAPGYGTPGGTFRPLRLEKDHYSREWDDAPMPYSIFFTEQGHAIHGTYHTRRLGSAVSHGCVRLSTKNAATLFALVKAEGFSGTEVVVTGSGMGDLWAGGYLPYGETNLPGVSRAGSVVGSSWRHLWEAGLAEATAPITADPAPGPAAKAGLTPPSQP